MQLSNIHTCTYIEYTFTCTYIIYTSTCTNMERELGEREPGQDLVAERANVAQS